MCVGVYRISSCLERNLVEIPTDAISFIYVLINYLVLYSTPLKEMPLSLRLVWHVAEPVPTVYHAFIHLSYLISYTILRDLTMHRS